MEAKKEDRIYVGLSIGGVVATFIMLAIIIVNQPSIDQARSECFLNGQVIAYTSTCVEIGTSQNVQTCWEDLNTAIAESQKLHCLGETVTLNVLGEEIQLKEFISIRPNTRKAYEEWKRYYSYED